MIDSMVNAPEFRTALWGILIVDPERHDTLYAHNAAKLFIPASNQKLVSGSVILEQLGPEFRFRTTFAAHGTIANGTLEGDLAVIGRGDPTMSARMMNGDAMAPLRAIADSLSQRGIRRITGRVVALGDAFPGPVRGAAWPWDGLNGASFAGVDELLFNEGLSTFRVRPGANVGDTAVVETWPSRSFPGIRVTATTIARDTVAASFSVAGGNGRGGRSSTGTRVTAFHDTLTSMVVVRGQIALGDSATITRPQHDPNTAFIAALTEALAGRGITVDGQTTTWTQESPVDSLFTILSVPLKEIMPAMMKPSQNQIAEVFLRTLGLERAGVGTADSGRRVVERQFATWGIPSDAFVVRDGSGLSRSDLISPEAIVSILEAMRHSPNFEVFFESLPIAGVDGTIRTRMRDTPAQGNLRAKTGTLSMVRSLSGYVRTADGRLLEFSMMCNNWTTPQAAVDRVQNTIGAALAQLRLD
ncbi:MAG TPA: D-alanyl-D-alanine carboxypeptidase/D-alanyl-D-alanine-endopeptidase [Gemmatimonadaceae bacterium]|jgi:D-alanyl-D-alanine carboxypeptidase/D-alanyl-D-alanine-endopeptidase (penicillin-binding protein 4)|nr:D-alanyl-D-alanine carboxypeptidase/D-alanyl-D-alanine-endopeptidase [Gemmatimonadaceae bacterium]